MAIDITHEQLLTYGEAAKLLPQGNRPGYTTWWRWTRRGISGVRLETVRIGGRCFTTAEAMKRFVAELSARDSDKFSANCSPIRRQRDQRVAESRLRQDGVL